MSTVSKPDDRWSTEAQFVDNSVAAFCEDIPDSNGVET